MGMVIIIPVILIIKSYPTQSTAVQDNRRGQLVTTNQIAGAMRSARNGARSGAVVGRRPGPA